MRGWKRGFPDARRCSRLDDGAMTSRTVAVDNLSFALEKGTVTGFLGLLFAAYGLAFALAGSRFVVRRDVT